MVLLSNDGLWGCSQLNYVVISAAPYCIFGASCLQCQPISYVFLAQVGRTHICTILQLVQVIWYHSIPNLSANLSLSYLAQVREIFAQLVRVIWYANIFGTSWTDICMIPASTRPGILSWSTLLDCPSASHCPLICWSWYYTASSYLMIATDAIGT